MFKDLVRSSGCKQFGKGTKTVSEQTLRQIMRDEADLLLRPSGFVFHESRCGSTLVANMLTEARGEKERPPRSMNIVQSWHLTMFKRIK